MQSNDTENDKDDVNGYISLPRVRKGDTFDFWLLTRLIVIIGGIALYFVILNHRLSALQIK